MSKRTIDFLPICKMEIEGDIESDDWRYTCGYTAGVECDECIATAADLSLNNGDASRALHPATGEVYVDSEFYRVRQAAPELLEALEALVRDVQDYPTRKPAWQLPCSAVDKARAAIAKAKEDKAHAV